MSPNSLPLHQQILPRSRHNRDHLRHRRTHVIKVRLRDGDFERDAYSIELRAYTRLGPQKRIIPAKKTSEGLQMERGTCLRGILQSNSDLRPPPPFLLATKLRWA